MREPLFRRPEAKPAVHGGKPIFVRGVRQHARCGAGMMPLEIPVNRLKRALREGQAQIGLWSSLSSHIAAEIVAGAGFDWILIDTEHSPNDLADVHRQLQAMQASATS